MSTDALMGVFGLSRVGFEVRVPQLVPPGANVREHHMARHRRVKKERAAVRAVLSQQEKIELPVVVTVTRCSAGRLDGHDNLPFAMKGTVDEIAEWLGLPNDRDQRVEWKYEQKHADKITRGTIIRIESKVLGKPREP